MTIKHTLWRRSIVIYGTALVSVMGIAITLPVLPALAQTFTLSEAELGILVLSFTLPGIFLAPVGGILADRIGRKQVLFPCLCIFAMGGLGASLANSLTEFLIWRVVQGCGAACLGVLYNTIIGDLYPNENDRLRIMGRAATVLSLGAALYPALGGLLGEVSWRWPLLLSLAALPLAVLVVFTPLPTLRSSNSMKHYARQMTNIVLHKKSLAHFALTLCAFCILYGPMITYFPLLAHNHYAASPSTIGTLFALSSLGTAVASLGLGRLSTQLQSRTLILAGVMCFGLSMLFMLLSSQTSLSLWMLLLPILFYGLGQGLAYPTIMSSLSSLAPSDGRGVLMAVNGTLLRLAQTIAPAICGVFFIWGDFGGVFTFGLLISVSMATVAGLTFERQPPN